MLRPVRIIKAGKFADEECAVTLLEIPVPDLGKAGKKIRVFRVGCKLREVIF